MNNKILLVSNTSWYIYNFRLGLAKHLQHLGCSVVAVAPYDSFSEKLKKEGIGFVQVNNLDRKGKNIFKDIALFCQLYKIYLTAKPDLIIHFTIKPNLYGSIAGKLSGIKCISSVTGLGHVFMEKSLVQTIVLGLYRWSFSCAEKVIFQNKEDMEFFLRKRILPSDKAVLIRSSGVNTDYFSPGILKDDRDNKKIIFLMACRLLKEKGIEEYIEGAKTIRQQYQNTEFHLLGPIDNGNPSGITEEKIKEWTTERIINYFPPVDDVREYISNCDIFVLPSYREGVSRSILEAMSMGKPIITTDTPGCRDTTEDGVTGFLVPPKDPMALTEAMERIINIGHDEREEMGKKGREKVIREFDERYVIKEYMDKVILT